MNRRELFQRLTGSFAACGLSDGVSIQGFDLGAEPSRTLIVIRAKGRLSVEARQNIAACWHNFTDGTPLEGLKAVVIDDELSIEVHRIGRISF